ncbi:hypothetical protein AAHW59_07270 [Klebsiella pneumoniae]|nr:hypothetical protein [Klebsiella pneumoniae]
MTDITELAQCEINDAMAELRRISDQPAISTHYARVLRKYIHALEKALEKAQGMETYWKTQCRGITDHCEELQARIAELESRTVKLPEPFELAKSSRGLTYYYADEVDAALTAAGIKVEAD